MLVAMKLFYTFWILLVWGGVNRIMGDTYAAVPRASFIIFPILVVTWVGAGILLWKTWRHEEPVLAPPVVRTTPEPTPPKPAWKSPTWQPASGRQPLADWPDPPAQIETLDERLDRARRARLDATAEEPERPA
jgi:cell division protein FtsN